MGNDIAIIGAGAAGCFAAANIPACPGREVIVFEKGNKPLQKVKVSGGGRCNVTHQLFDIPELAGCYPRGERLLKKALHHFSPADAIDWFAKRGVTLVAQDDGRMFPSTNSSQTIMDCLLDALAANQASIRYQKAVTKLEPLSPGYRLHFTDGSHHDAAQVLVSTGGFPKAEQFSWLAELGHTIQTPAPSLFTFNLPKHPVNALMGLSVPDAVVRIEGTKIVTRGPLLITHWGLSGPAVLRASAWGARELQSRQYDFAAIINWLPDQQEDSLKNHFLRLRQQSGKQPVHATNPFSLPKRLWQFFLSSCKIEAHFRWGDLPSLQQQCLIIMLCRNELRVQGKTTFKDEFVTCGGISTSEINPQTMESRLHPGLYFAGETIDVDGITGGFNFQWAWCSGRLAAKAMDRSAG